ncbi:potassium channel family protein [Flavobacteriaceae sp. LMIT009]
MSRLLLLLFFLSLTLLVLNLINKESSDTTNYFKFGAYFLFYAVVTLEIIRQVWQSKVVQKNVILGLISGYISLGLLSFFTCLTIEIIYPNSYSGLNPSLEISDQLMYYAYITLMTIGYGDILPITPIAQKAAILIGLIGQFYLVILTAIVVGKYLSQHTNNR